LHHGGPVPAPGNPTVPAQCAVRADCPAELSGVTGTNYRLSGRAPVCYRIGFRTTGSSELSEKNWGT
jgi:hypothetical protein